MAATPHATPQATQALALSHPELPQAYRLLDGLTVSSLGLGTYLGRDNTEDDEKYLQSALLMLSRGVNLLDTAINYRSQRSERVLGQCLARLPELGLTRSQVVVCSKAGFLPFDGTTPTDGPGFLRRMYVESGIIPAAQVAGGVHSLWPAHLQQQLGRSLRNLGLSCLDVFYLHNPEYQLEFVSKKELRQRLRAAFQLCEQEQQAGRLQRYGCATWDGFRVPPGQPGHLSLAELVEIAEEVAGPQHHFRVIQLPLSAKLSEAALSATQVVAGKAMTLLEAAQRLQIAVVTSGPLSQGKLVQRPLPPKFCDRLPDLTRDSHRLLQFARSAPGVAAVLCGSKERRHALENLAILTVPPLSAAEFQARFGDAGS